MSNVHDFVALVNTLSTIDRFERWWQTASELEKEQIRKIVIKFEGPVDAKNMLKWFNECRRRYGISKRDFPESKSNLSLISARIREYDEDTVRQVVVMKTRQWASDEYMHKYIRPATLFNATNFAQYVGELDG